MLTYTLPAIAFNGEHQRTDDNYQAFLQRVSAEAKMRNVEEAERRIASERNGFDIKKMLYKMGRDPEYISSPHFDGASELCHRVKVGAAGFEALDIFYNWENKYKPNLGDGADSEVARLWIGGMENRQAVTNRKKIVVQELVRAISIVEDDVVRIFSLAGGDAQVIIEAIKHAGRKVEVILIDPNREALASAKQRAKDAGLEDSFIIKRGLASTARKIVAKFKPHIFDVVGLMDYLSDDKVTRIVSMAKETLQPGGVFLTCNIVDNKEREFLENVILWDMTYRDPKELGKLIVCGGFNEDDAKTIIEPFGIHAIVIALKK